MGVFEMVLGIVALSLTAGIVNNHIKHRNTGNKHRKDLDERLQRLDDLERRVQTLETIVTDESYQLKQKYKDL